MENTNLIEHTWNTTPLTVFGILVTLLVFANFVQWRRNSQLQDIILEQNAAYTQAAVDFTLLMRQTLESVEEIKSKMLSKFLDK
jgi:hypothetical protein